MDDRNHAGVVYLDFSMASLPFQFFLATGSPADSIKVTNVVKVLGSLMDNLFSPSNNLERSCLQSKMNAVYD